MVVNLLKFFFLNQVWDPELYELHGGSPFSTKSDGNLTDSSGTHLYLMGDVRKIMNEICTWKQSLVFESNLTVRQAKSSSSQAVIGLLRLLQ